MALVLKSGDLKGQEEDEGDLDDLVGLDVHGEAGDDPVQGQPVPVAARLHAQGGQKEEDQGKTEEQEPFPVLFGEQLEIHVGQDHVRHHTQTDADELHQNNFVVVLKAGGGVDQHQRVTKASPPCSWNLTSYFITILWKRKPKVWYNETHFENFL